MALYTQYTNIHICNYLCVCIYVYTSPSLTIKPRTYAITSISNTTQYVKSSFLSLLSVDIFSSRETQLPLSSVYLFICSLFPIPNHANHLLQLTPGFTKEILYIFCYCMPKYCFWIDYKCCVFKFVFHMFVFSNRNTIDFCVLILYTAALLNLFIDSRFFLRFDRIFYIDNYVIYKERQVIFLVFI